MAITNNETQAGHTITQGRDRLAGLPSHYAVRGTARLNEQPADHPARTNLERGLAPAHGKKALSKPKIAIPALLLLVVAGAMGAVALAVLERRESRLARRKHHRVRRFTDRRIRRRQWRGTIPRDFEHDRR